MIRIANPGSDIEQLVAIFKKNYAQLSDFSSFNPNNMAEVMTAAKMASSKGYVGEEALKRSYAVKKISLNPLFNSAKMYAEVYRMLGWITSVDRALDFKFTLLGAHVALSGQSTKSIVEQCLLGISFPNEIIKIKFTNIGNPFMSILRYLNELDDVISRNEIIIGAMNLNDSKDEKEFSESVALIKTLRSAKNSKASMIKEMNQLSEKIGIACDTMGNYTRVLISILKYTGWVEEVKLDIYGKNSEFLKLTDYGKEFFSKFSELKHISLIDLESLSDEQINAVCKIGFLKFLKMAGFSVEEDLNGLIKEASIVEDIFKTTNIFFNPFQTYSIKNITRYFPEGNIETDEKIKKEFKVDELKDSDDLAKQQNKEIHAEKTIYSKRNHTANTIKSILKKNSNNEKLVIDELLEEILVMKQTKFYPLVADLFQIIFQTDARTPQAGVNNERFDVIIPDEQYSIPVEVKSPTEELMLSVKAIRQALENKVILLSRNNYTTEKSISSLAVGYNIPNKRSDVYMLIEDIKRSYDINIAITSIEQLLNAAVNCLKNGKKYSIADFKDVYGVIKFEDL